MVIYLRCWWERWRHYRPHLEEFFPGFFFTITWQILDHLAWPLAHFDCTEEGYKMICSEIHETHRLPMTNPIEDLCLVTFVKNPIFNKVLLGVSITCIEVGFDGGIIWKCVNCDQNNLYKSACVLCDHLANRSLIDKAHFVCILNRTSGCGWWHWW